MGFCFRQESLNAAQASCCCEVQAGVPPRERLCQRCRCELGMAVSAVGERACGVVSKKR